jgi:hypothetical protein
MSTKVNQLVACEKNVLSIQKEQNVLVLIDGLLLIIVIILAVLSEGCSRFN